MPLRHACLPVMMPSDVDSIDTASSPVVPGDLTLAYVHAKPRLADPLEAVDGRFGLVSVVQIDLYGGEWRAAFLHLIALDESLLHEGSGYLQLQFRRGDRHGLMARGDRVANSS